MEYEARVFTKLGSSPKSEAVSVKRVRLTAESEEDAREQLAKEYDLTERERARLKPQQIELLGDFWAQPPGGYVIGTALGAGVVPRNVRCWSCSKEMDKGFITLRRDGKPIYLVFCNPECVYNYFRVLIEGEEGE